MLYTQDRFIFDHNGVQFCDAITLPVEEYKKLTPTEIETIKADRFTNWKKAISTPPVVVEPTSEELTKQVASIDEQIQVLTAQKEELSAKAVMLEEVVSVKEVIKK